MLVVSAHLWQNPVWICPRPHVYDAEGKTLISLDVEGMMFYIRGDQADQIADALRDAAARVRDFDATKGQVAS